MEGLGDLLQNATLRRTSQQRIVGTTTRRRSARSDNTDSNSPMAISANEEQPSYVQYVPRGTKERQVLHVAILHKAPSEVISEIIQDDPSLLRVQDAGGLTPLHLCLSIEDVFFNKQVFLILFEAYPEAVSIPNAAGNFPLYTACRRVEQLVHLSYEQGTKIKLIPQAKPNESRRKDVTLIHTLIDAYPEAVNQRNKELMTPIHAALRDGTPLDIVNLLIKASNSSLRVQNKKGQTPLLLGIISSAPKEVLEVVLMEHPKAASTGDWDAGSWKEPTSPRGGSNSNNGEGVESPEISLWNGNIPLHMAIRNHYPEDFLRQLLEHHPEASTTRDREGMLPLHLAILHNCEPTFITELIRVFPGATELPDGKGQSILHMALGYKNASFSAISIVVWTTPGLVHTRRQEKYVLPLHLAMAIGVNLRIVKLLIDEFADAACVEDYYDNRDYPLHYGLFALQDAVESDQENDVLNILSCIAIVFDAFPEVSRIRDSEKQTPLFRLCQILKHIRKPTQECFDLMLKLRRSFPEAVEMSCSGGASPINSLVEECILSRDLDTAISRGCVKKLKILAAALTDGRALRPLCSVSGWTTQQGRRSKQKGQIKITSPQLLVFLLLFDNVGEDRPVIDLNSTVFPRWTFLEMLADFDTPESSKVLLQIVQSQKRLLKEGSPQIFDIYLELYGFKTSSSFVSMGPVDEKVLTKVADRAKLSKSSSALKQWGKEYGRFLRRYRVEDAPKHVSETCVVVFATEAYEDSEGRLDEVHVALKFMDSEVAFCREIKNREGTQGDFVMPIRAIYSSRNGVDVACNHIEDKNFGMTDLHEHLAFLSTRTKDFEFLLVMERGAGVDLHDVINHRNIAGRDLLCVLSIAREVAGILRYLNESCSVIHGDVKARNFVSLGVGLFELRAVDLDNAASIANGELAGQKRTSSGYLPPEMGAVESLRRSGAPQPIDCSGKVDALKESMQAALAANDFVEVTRISQELNQASLAQSSNPEEVVASPQYDMWCFGALLYYLCTGIQLFNMDVREEIIEDAELAKLVDWNDELKQSKLNKIAQGWPKALISRLLQKDPSNRPRNWDSIIQELDMFGNNSTKKASSGGHVFISYSRKDTKIMKEIYDYLVNHNIPVWMDVELTPGTAGWTHAIEKALLDADAVVVVCSIAAKKSEWVTKEILHAHDRQIPMLPLLIEADAGQCIPFAIYDVQHIDCRNNNISQFLPTILKSVEGLLSSRP